MSSKHGCTKRMSAARDTKGTVKRLLGYLECIQDPDFIFVIDLYTAECRCGTVAGSALFIQGR